jgi:hypothetical protein
VTEPTKDECFARFWDIIAAGLHDLNERGLLEPTPEPLDEAA